jgi:hypothetical protein
MFHVEIPGFKVCDGSPHMRNAIWLDDNDIIIWLDDNEYYHLAG